MKYISTKTYKQLGSVCYRQWRADSHCNQLHGYPLSFHFEFEADTVDARNWIIDFGSLRPLKEKLEEWFDHTLLVAQDDPQRDLLLSLGKSGIAKIVEIEKAGCEGLADFLYEYVNTIFLPTLGTGEVHRVWCCKVEVRETDSNMAMRTGHYEDNEFDTIKGRKMTIDDLKYIFRDQFPSHKMLNFCLVNNGVQDMYEHSADDLSGLLLRLDGYWQISDQRGYDIKTDLSTRPRFENKR
jgi:6-pyruvoyltetrahydropterin/6-carboxytetrahydropterin synthase